MKLFPNSYVVLCSALPGLDDALLYFLSPPGEMDDWDRQEVRSAQAGVQNVVYFNDEEEEEEDGDEGEQGEEGRKVMVRTKHS